MRNWILKASVLLAALTWVITASFIDFTSWAIPVMNILSLIYISLFALANRKKPRSEEPPMTEAKKGVRYKSFYNIVLNEEVNVK